MCRRVFALPLYDGAACVRAIVFDGVCVLRYSERVFVRTIFLNLGASVPGACGGALFGLTRVVARIDLRVAATVR